MSKKFKTIYYRCYLCGKKEKVSVPISAKFLGTLRGICKRCRKNDKVTVKPKFY